jgi:hypothetical protein
LQIFFEPEFVVAAPDKAVQIKIINILQNTYRYRKLVPVSLVLPEKVEVRYCTKPNSVDAGMIFFNQVVFFEI